MAHDHEPVTQGQSLYAPTVPIGNSRGALRPQIGLATFGFGNLWFGNRLRDSGKTLEESRVLHERCTDEGYAVENVVYREWDEESQKSVERWFMVGLWHRAWGWTGGCAVGVDVEVRPSGEKYGGGQEEEVPGSTWWYVGEGTQRGPLPLFGHTQAIINFGHMLVVIYNNIIKMICARRWLLGSY